MRRRNDKLAGRRERRLRFAALSRLQSLIRRKRARSRVDALRLKKRFPIAAYSGRGGPLFALNDDLDETNDAAGDGGDGGTAARRASDDDVSTSGGGDDDGDGEDDRAEEEEEQQQRSGDESSIDQFEVRARERETTRTREHENARPCGRPRESSARRACG